MNTLVDAAHTNEDCGDIPIRSEQLLQRIVLRAIPKIVIVIDCQNAIHAVLHRAAPPDCHS